MIRSKEVQNATKDFSDVFKYKASELLNKI